MTVDIGHFVPPNLKREFYHGVKGHKHTKHDGYDPYGFPTNGLLLYLPLWALKGDSFKSVDRYKHTATVTDASWQPDGRLFTGDPDYIDTGFKALNTGDNFTIGFWLKTTTARTGVKYLMAVYDGTGFIQIRLNSESAGYLEFMVYDGTNQIAAYDNSETWRNGSWHLYHFIKRGNDETDLYILENGIDITDGYHQEGTMGAHDLTKNFFFAARNNNDTSEGFTDGTWGEVWAYNRDISVAEALHNYKTTAWRY